MIKNTQTLIIHMNCWQTPISNWYKLLASTILRIELPLEFTVEQFFIRNWLKFHDMYLPLLDENWTSSNDKSYVISLQITNTCNVCMCLKQICHICNLKWKWVTAGKHQFQNWHWWLFDTNFKIVIDCWQTPISKLILIAVRNQFQNWYWWLFDNNFKIVIDCWQTPISNWYKVLASTILRIELPLKFTLEQFFVRNWLKFHDLCLPLLDENWTCSNDKSYVILLQITNTCNVYMSLKHICHICNLKLKCVTAGRHQFQNWYW